LDRLRFKKKNNNIDNTTQFVTQTRIIYVFTNNLLNSFQSDLSKHFSTEKTVLTVHDHIIKATSHQQVTCLTRLELSAIFDIVNHSILLELLSSWFGISSTALSWINSYLLNRSFYVNIENSKSSEF